MDLRPRASGENVYFLFELNQLAVNDQHSPQDDIVEVQDENEEEVIDQEENSESNSDDADDDDSDPIDHLDLDTGFN